MISRPRLIALVIAGLVLAFALGFFPQWSRARTLDRELAQTRFELRMSNLEGELGAALAESLRSNYERARQLTADFYTTLQDNIDGATPEQRSTLESILSQRDELITLLSRADPESTQRLMLLYTRYFAAMNPIGQATPATVTPSP